MIVEFKWIEEIQMFILGRRGNRGTEPSPAWNKRPEDNRGKGRDDLTPQERSKYTFTSRTFLF